MRTFFPEDDVASVQQCEWSGVTNGKLLCRAEGQFDVLILADKNLRYQQNLSGRQIAIVELPSNRWPVLELLALQVASAVHGAMPGSYAIVSE
jgi:hypothetical protein